MRRAVAFKAAAMTCARVIPSQNRAAAKYGESSSLMHDSYCNSGAQFPSVGLCSLGRPLVLKAAFRDNTGTERSQPMEFSRILILFAALILNAAASDLTPA